VHPREGGTSADAWDALCRLKACSEVDGGKSAAYVVCTHFGLDVEVRASRYIAVWDGDSKALRESLERIANTARDLIDHVDGLATRKAVA